MICFLTICLFVRVMTTANDIPPIRDYVGLMPSTRSIAIAAHNDLSGAEFYKLKIGDEIQYNDTVYTVKDTLLLQALDPLNTYTDYVDTETNDRLTAVQAAKLVFDRPGQLVLFTCYRKGDENSWGRYFIFAEKKNTKPRQGAGNLPGAKAPSKRGGDEMLESRTEAPFVIREHKDFFMPVSGD